jgi:hypothetical protein
MLQKNHDLLLAIALSISLHALLIHCSQTDLPSKSFAYSTPPSLVVELTPRSAAFIVPQLSRNESGEKKPQPWQKAIRENTRTQSVTEHLSNVVQSDSWSSQNASSAAMEKNIDPVVIQGVMMTIGEMIQNMQAEMRQSIACQYLDAASMKCSPEIAPKLKTKIQQLIAVLNYANGLGIQTPWEQFTVGEFTLRLTLEQPLERSEEKITEVPRQ